MNQLGQMVGYQAPTVGPTVLDLFQFVQTFFSTGLQAAVVQDVAAAQAAVRGWLHAAVGLWILVTCYLALAQNLSLSRLFSRVLRVLIVMALTVDINLYNQFILQPVTTGVPNIIAYAFGGGLGAQTIPGQFSAIFTEIEHLTAALRTQASGITYVADRIMIWAVGIICKLFLVPQFAIYIVTQAFLYLLVLAGTVAVIFWMFDATKGYAEAWAGKIVGALITMMLMSGVIQLVFMMNGQYMQHIANLPMADGADVSVSKGIDTLTNAAATFAFGFLMMVISTVVGFGIGRATGFDAGRVLRTVTGRPR